MRNVVHEVGILDADGIEILANLLDSLEIFFVVTTHS